MRQNNFISCKRLGLLCTVLGLSGCISIPTSPTPRFYALAASSDLSVSKSINLPSDVIIGVGPVTIPEYLDRPQIVTMTPSKMLQFAQFDRWGESLNLGLARIIREDLAGNLGKAKLTLYPWNPSMEVKYQVLVEIVQFDSQIDGNMTFEVQWTIVDLQKSKVLMIKKSVFRQAINPQNYSGLVQTISKACALLSAQIAQFFCNLGVIASPKGEAISQKIAS